MPAKLCSAYLLLLCCHLGYSQQPESADSALRFKPLSSTDPPPVAYAAKNFTSQIDNFAFEPSLGRFTLRYLINDSFYSPGSPILFYTGNEGRIEAFAQNTLIMWQLAPVLNAALIFVEHRYYGNSMPFGQRSFDNASMLAYLTAEQALADYASFLTSLQSLEPQLTVKASPVIAIGGSYGGMLAAWMRAKYPHLVHGALASSAPVLQFVNVTSCYAFNQAVSNAFERASGNCSVNIRHSWDAIDRVASAGQSGLDKLSSIFATCRQMSKATEDAAALKGWLSGAYVTAAMVNYPYPANFLLPLPAWPVSAICQPIAGDPTGFQTDADLLAALSTAVKVYYNFTGVNQCLNLTVDPASQSLDAAGWNVQSCNEMVMPDSCANGVTDMFQPTGDFNLTAYASQCVTQYGVTPRPAWAMTQFAGAVDPVACSNIFYANGDLDPWAPGGVAKSPNPSCPAVIMHDAAHHLDLRASDPRDPPDVTRVRRLQLMSILDWTRQFWQRRGAEPPAPAPAGIRWVPIRHADVS